MNLDDGDVERILRIGPQFSDLPTGEYSDNRPSLWLTGQPFTPVARMVAAHEGAHAWLNDRTAYGNAVMCFVSLATDPRYTQAVDDHLGCAVGAMRHTQETFATWTGVQWAGGDESTLKSYAGYEAYYATARSCGPDWPDGTYLRSLAVEGVCRAAMQNGALARAAEHGLGAVFTSPLHDDERPDERLAVLLSALDWGHLHQRFATASRQISL